MKVLKSVSLGYFLSAAITLGHCMSQNISASPSRPAESLPDNFIVFQSAPDRVVDGSVVHVHYRCSRPCQLAVEVVVSTLKKTDLVVFRRKWISSTPGVSGTHRVQLRLPPSILYQQDFYNKRVLNPQRVAVRAWLDHLYAGSEHKTYENSMFRAYNELQTTPLSERPRKHPTVCPSWSALLIWHINRNKSRQCQHESDIIDMLTFPMASSGEHFGVIRRLKPFMDRSLERARRQAVTKPRVTLSVWIYLLRWCHRGLCGIIHHMDGKNSYDTVLMQLTDAGDIIIQVRVTSREDDAFRAGLTLPLRKWIRLDCCILDSMVLLDATWDDMNHKVTYGFKESIRFDDTDGYFVFGGGRFMLGIHGYLWSAKLYRFGNREVENQLPPNSTLTELDQIHNECLELKASVKAFFEEVIKSHPASHTSIGNSPCKRPWGLSGEKICNQAWTLENQHKYNKLFRFLQSKQEEIQTGTLSMKNLGEALFEHSLKTMFNTNQERNEMICNSTSLLQESSCFGNHKASLLLATIHLSGLGHSINLQKGHAYSLIGAAADNRFALLHAGYKHSQGIDGFQKDLDLAYSYYSNIGQRSSLDFNKIYENKQQTVEHIYLHNEEDLNRYNHEKTNVLEFLKFQAERGDVGSQRQLALMLYRGENGALKNMESAVQWFERSAMQMTDPEAMYDYSIILMKGEGVKKNNTRGFQLMQKAAKMGSIRALNGLGWYYGNVLHDHRNAVKHFKQAALNGNEDGIFNLGIYHLNGMNPDKPVRNETAAFHQFLRASWYGHVAGAVESAWYLSTGNLEGVSRDVERAVMMLKKVCDQNGHLGFMVQEALQAYLQGSRQEAFVKYVLVAETGLGLAQTNTAHLCEELNLRPDCQWRYHNYSVLNYDPHPAALLKMGDYYYPPSSARADSLSSLGRAVSMYGRAAVAGSPQGMFNLVVLAQQGHALPSDIYSFFNLSQYDEQHTVTEKILKRCVAVEIEDAVTPCSLALLGVQMGKALSTMTQSSAQLILVYASLLSVFVITVMLSLQSCLGERTSSQHVRTRTLPVNQDEDNSDREQNGIIGETTITARIFRIITQKGELWLGQTGDLVVTVSGVCLCIFWTTLLYHML